MKYFKFLVLTCLSFFLFLILPQDSFAATYYVAGDTGLDTNNGSITTPWKTIQKAAGTALQPGDTVNVKGGLTYAETVTPSTSGTLGGGYITYQAWSGTGIPKINKNGFVYAFNLSNRNYIIIDGFMIYGLNSSGTPSGIRLSASTNITIKNNIIYNTNYGIDGLLVSSTSNIKVYNNTIYNTTYAGLRLGIMLGGETTVELKNNIVVNSQDESGITRNSYGSQPSIYNNVVFGNLPTNYFEWEPGINDINMNPLFLNSSDFNFRIMSASPARDSGILIASNTKDVLGVPRPQGSGFDIGAYEYYDIPVSLSSIPLSSSNDNSPSFVGTASTIDTGTISSVSYSVDGGTWQTSGVTGTTDFSFTIPNLPDGTHTVRVKATDSYTNETDSSIYATSTFTIDTVNKTTSVNNTCTAVKPEGTPVITSITNLTPTSVKLMFSDSWTNTVDSYFVEYGTKPNVYQYSTQSIGGKGTKETTISNLTPNKTYYFRIRNGNNCNVGNWSLPISIKNEELIVNNLETPTPEPKTDAKEIVTPKPTATPISVVQTNQKTNILQTIINWLTNAFNKVF